MRALIGLCLLLASGAADAADRIEDPVIEQVKARDAELMAAHGSGDMATYRAGVSARYAYIDVGGSRVNADKLVKRRENDNRRVVSSETSEEEAVRISDTVVLLRGLDSETSTYYGGLPRAGKSRWSALWVREDDGVWRLTAETATPVTDSEALPFVPAPQSGATLAALAGRWKLALQPSLELVLAAEDGKLIGTIPGQTARFVFAPASATHFFAEDRPFELRFANDGQSLQLVTWGIPTAAARLIE
ncbi:MAG: nuclear transport factor 2 family protein [Pseudoxanthomonas sp.]